MGEELQISEIKKALAYTLHLVLRVTETITAQTEINHGTANSNTNNYIK